MSVDKFKSMGIEYQFTSWLSPIVLGSRVSCFPSPGLVRKSVSGFGKLASTENSMANWRRYMPVGTDIAFDRIEMWWVSGTNQAFPLSPLYANCGCTTLPFLDNVSLLVPCSQYSIMICNLKGGVPWPKVVHPEGLIFFWETRVPSQKHTFLGRKIPYLEGGWRGG